MITGSIQAEAAGQMLDAAHQAGAKALLSLDGGPSALDAGYPGDGQDAGTDREGERL